MWQQVNQTPMIAPATPYTMDRDARNQLRSTKVGQIPN
jgi:hypothetical protein